MSTGPTAVAERQRSSTAAQHPAGAPPLETLRLQIVFAALGALIVAVLTFVDSAAWSGPWLPLSFAGVAAATTIAFVGRLTSRARSWMPIAVPILDILSVTALLQDGELPRLLAMLSVLPAFWLGTAARTTGIVIAGITGVAMATSMALQIPYTSETTLAANAVGAVLVPFVLVATAWFAARIRAVQDRQRLAILTREREKAALMRERAADADRLDAVFETARVGLLILDAHGRIERANSAIARHRVFADSTATNDELLAALGAATFTSMQSQQPLARDDNPLFLAARGEPLDNMTFWLERPGQDRIAISASSRPLTAEGRFSGSIVSLDDITMYMRMLEDRDDFVALVSHELRTPLTSISGYLELALDEELPDHVDAWLHTVQRNADRLRHLVEDLLVVGEMSRGDLRLQPEDADLRAVIEEAVATLDHRAQRRGVALTLLPGDPVPVRIDARRIGQVAENLISNGIKYTSDDGFVEVRIEREGEGVRVLVRDNGPGIPPEEAARVFERFYRSTSARASGVQGAGLGLWICRTIITGHGGVIAFESTPGTGSTASFWLPAGQ